MNARMGLKSMRGDAVRELRSSKMGRERREIHVDIMKVGTARGVPLEILRERGWEHFNRNRGGFTLKE